MNHSIIIHVQIIDWIILHTSKMFDEQRAAILYIFMFLMKTFNKDKNINPESENPLIISEHDVGAFPTTVIIKKNANLSFTIYIHLFVKKNGTKMHFRLEHTYNGMISFKELNDYLSNNLNAETLSNRLVYYRYEYV